MKGRDTKNLTSDTGRPTPTLNIDFGKKFSMKFDKLFLKVRLFFLKKRMRAVSMVSSGRVPRYTSRSAETLYLLQLLTSRFVALHMRSRLCKIS